MPPFSSKQSSAIIDIDELELVRDGLKVLFKPKKEWDYTLKLDMLILKKDSSIMNLKISNEGKMPLMKNR